MSSATSFAIDKYVLLQFKSGLREQQRDLHERIDQAERELRVLASSGPGDIADNASGNSLENSAIAELSQNRSRLRSVELALDRIRSGDFGLCGECGGPIGLRRLQAVPSTSHCIQCQERREQANFDSAAYYRESVGASGSTHEYA